MYFDGVEFFFLCVSHILEHGQNNIISLDWQQNNEFRDFYQPNSFALKVVAREPAAGSPWLIIGSNSSVDTEYLKKVALFRSDFCLAVFCGPLGDFQGHLKLER